MSSADKKTLWGPMTTELNFGEDGTVIRPAKGLPPVRIKGVFYREDSEYIRELKSRLEWYESTDKEVHAECTRASEEKYPGDAHWRSSGRVQRIVNEVISLRGKNSALSVKVAQLLEITEKQRQQLETQQEKYRDAIIKMRDSILTCALGVSDSEMEKCLQK